MTPCSADCQLLCYILSYSTACFGRGGLLSGRRLGRSNVIEETLGTILIMSWAALAQEINKIPPITRLFIGSAVIIAAPLFAKIYGPQAYAFSLNLIVTKLQVSTTYF